MQELRGSPAGAAPRIDAFAWGGFFIWIGIAFLADLGWSTGILGVGVIALAAQVARRTAGLRVDPFGLCMGLAMVAWAAWDFLQPQRAALETPAAFWPVLLIAVGVGLVGRGLLPRPRMRRRPPADMPGDEA